MNKGNNIFVVLLRVLLGLILVLSFLQVKMKFGWDPLKDFAIYGSSYVYADSVHIESITLPKSIELNGKESRQIPPLIIPAEAKNTNLLWRSSDTSIANVDSKGLVTATGKVGACEITANATDGSRSYAVTKVHVTKPKEPIVLVSSIDLKEVNRMVTLKEKDTDTIKVNVSPEKANNKTLSWKSSDTNIATVNSSGVVTAIKPGSCTITIRSTDGSRVISSIKVIVEKKQKMTKVAHIELGKTSIEMFVGEIQQIRTQILPRNTSNKVLNWYSSDSNIATVYNGKVTAVKPGKCVIKVSSTDGSNKIAKCSVLVKKKEKNENKKHLDLTANKKVGSSEDRQNIEQGDLYYENWVISGRTDKDAKIKAIAHYNKIKNKNKDIIQRIDNLKK